MHPLSRHRVTHEMTGKSPDRQWYEQYVKNNRVFILGAGFSAAAGVPLTDSMLKKAMSKFAVECPSIFERVDGYAKESMDSLESEVDY